MKIGYVQMAPVLGDAGATITRLEPLLVNATGADLLVLPELCNSGYNFTSREQAMASAESAGDGRFVRFLVEQCRKLDCHIVAGLNERDGEQLFNSSVLIGSKGVLGVYRKLHLFVNEKDIFSPGNLGLPVFDLGFCRVGMLVCFDWRFPEAWRALALEGADIICHPSNLVVPDQAQRVVPVHALLNRVFVVTANRIGAEGDLTFTGRSIISDPGGTVLSEAPAESKQVATVVVDIAQARDKAVTPRNDAFADRRPDQYRRLVEAD